MTKSMDIEKKTLQDMKVNEVKGDDYKEVVLHYYDKTSRKVYYTDIETHFPSDKKIISVTDLDGYIIQVNEVFVHMSGFSRKELIGMPHSILRHPDMPRIAFKGLWDALNKDGHWHGYVKNLRKDGGFYWVSASVFALHRHGKVVGYTSSRGPAPRDQVIACTKLYKELLDKEMRNRVS